MWRDSNPRWALARHQIKSLARSPLRSHIRSVCLCCSFCCVLVVGGRGRNRTFCHPVIGRGPRHSDSLPVMVRSAGIEPAAFAMSWRRSVTHVSGSDKRVVGTPAGIRTPECRCVGPMPLSAWRRERDVVRAASFELAKLRGLSPARLPVPPRPQMVPPDRLERSRPKPAVFETAASANSAKRALVRAEGLEPPRCYPSHSECGASACSATRAWCSLVASIHPPPRYQPGALPNELRERC